MPRRFTFRFQQLLDIAFFEEDEVKNRLSAKNAQIAELDAKIQGIINTRENALKQQEIDLQEGNIDKVKLYPNYLMVLQNQQKNVEKERDLQIEQRDKIMSELIEKQRQRKTYEILKEKDLAAFNKENLRQEQKILDEFKNRLGSDLGDEYEEDAE